MKKDLLCCALIMAALAVIGISCLSVRNGGIVRFPALESGIKLYYDIDVAAKSVEMIRDAEAKRIEMTKEAVDE